MASTFCRNHSERPGIGICPACVTPICEECATRVDGILRCRSCLAGTAGLAAPIRWRSASALAPAAVLLPLAWLAASFAFYSLAVGIVAAGELSRWIQAWMGGAVRS